VILPLFRESGTYDCNTVFNSSVHPWKKYIEKLMASGKKSVIKMTISRTNLWYFKDSIYLIYWRKS